MNRRITSILAAGAIAAGLAGGIGACGSSGSSGPPNATSVLQSDGYTPSASYTSSLQSGIGNSDGQVLSSQAGTNGDNVQLVIVFDNAADASAGASAVQTQYGSDGIATSTNGQVMTATGTVEDFATAGQ